jgi:putative NADPH-quinone reductase
MPKRIAIIDGHPDPDRARLLHALADAYAEGARSAGHEVKTITLATLEVPYLRSQREWDEGIPVPPIRESQEAIEWAEHLVILYPLWMGAMPALLKAFFEQVFRPGFAIERGKVSLRVGRLKGRSARIVVTMGMPVFFYRLYFRAHGLKNLKRNILGLVGIGPVRETLIGMVGAADEKKRQGWFKTVHALGREGR